MNVRVPLPELPGSPSRRRLTVCGQVQGVGFRPHALRCARELGLSGWVLNHGDGVTIEVQGERAQHFEALLRDTLPPLARIDSLHSVAVAASTESGFTIRHSDRGTGQAVVPPDVAICSTCLSELFDAQNRRYLHPFIACTDCGPRYSMARSLPYDRDSTAMADFELCAHCALEYEDPQCRRLHAEPIACHDCGPHLSQSIKAIAAAIARGEIVALKGIGGYHLVCDAGNTASVRRLRQRKRRDAKPFAMMMLNCESLAGRVVMNESLREILRGPERPIVVADRAPGCELYRELGPGLDTLGVMLPHTAVHYLLFHALAGRPEGTAWLGQRCEQALVMTSANVSGEPMLVDDDQARAELGEVADLIVSHDRAITHGCDDSVLRACAAGYGMIRRGRGYAPGAYALQGDGEPVLALGAHLKNTVCVLRGDQGFMSSHIGDLESPAMHRLIDARARELVDWLKVSPAAIACDLHPDYASTRLAERLGQELEIPVMRVQHHHAHIAAVAAVEGHEGPVLGLALDGHGMGSDGGSWGGELLYVHGAQSTRVGHLRPLAAPGGDQSARHPWRLAMAFAARRNRDWGTALPDAALSDAVRSLALSEHCPMTTACGRYFDTAAALLGICHHSRYEAEAPMRLESACRELRSDAGLYSLDDGVLDLDLLLERLLGCEAMEPGSSLFHGTLLNALVDWVSWAADTTGVSTVVLGGGCFLNAVLAGQLPPRLRAKGLAVLASGQRLTTGDGALSIGQAVVARELLADPGPRESCFSGGRC